MSELAAVISRVTHTRTHTLKSKQTLELRVSTRGQQSSLCLTPVRFRFLCEMFDFKGHFYHHDSISVCVTPPPQQDIYMGDLSVQWDNIIGLEEAKKLVKEAVVYPIKVRCCLDLLPFHLWL